MSLCNWRGFAVLLPLVAFAPNAHATQIFLRSGNVAPVAQDISITYLVEPSGVCAQPFAAAFTAADFAAADAGPLAWSTGPAHPAWGTSLWCDPLAGWISTGADAPSRSALYSVPFNVTVPQPCCIQSATLDFCWMADDQLGDPASQGPNPIGVYLDGQLIPIAGGNYAAGTRVIVDITNYLHCGPSHLYIYNRDLGCAVAGINFTATITYNECATPTRSQTWGQVRALYRD